MDRVNPLETLLLMLQEGAKEARLVPLTRLSLHQSSFLLFVAVAEHESVLPFFTLTLPVYCPVRHDHSSAILVDAEPGLLNTHAHNRETGVEAKERERETK